MSARAVPRVLGVPGEAGGPAGADGAGPAEVEQTTAGRLRQVVDSLHEVPVVLRSRHLDVLASNDLARRLSAAFEPGVNMARFAFLDPGVPTGTDDPSEVAHLVVASLRSSLESQLEDAGFRALVGELAARSDDFSRAWAERRPAPPGSGSLTVRHPLVRGMRLAYQELQTGPEDEGAVLILWRAVDALSRDRLQQLRTTGPPGPPRSPR